LRRKLIPIEILVDVPISPFISLGEFVVFVVKEREVILASKVGTITAKLPSNIEKR